MKKKVKKFWVWTGLAAMTSSVIASSVLLTHNIQDIKHMEAARDEAIARTFESPDNSKEWNIDNISFIKDHTNYWDQSRNSDLSTIFMTTAQGSSKQYVKNVITASDIGNLNINENYSGMTSVQLVNTTSTIQQLLKTYKNRYATNQNDITAWSSINVTPTTYYAKNLLNNTYQILSGIPNFTTKGVMSKSTTDPLASKINDMYELKKIKWKPQNIEINQPIIMETPNNFYEITPSTYDQITNDGITPSQTRRQIVVTTKDKNDAGKYFIDNSTIDFWIDFIMNPVFDDYARIVVEPANLIIYRSNPANPVYDISLSDASIPNLISSTDPYEITLSNWAASCINSNPTNDFDFRASLSKALFDPSIITSINIPRIITIDSSTYSKSKHNWKEPTLIPPAMLYAEKPAGTPDRNWGTEYFESLTEITVSMNSYAPNDNDQNGFHIYKVNDTRVKTDYTNAESNTGNLDMSGGSITSSPSEIFANQFFVAPKLERFNTTSLSDFFKNFNFINQLPIFYKYHEPNFSLASYNRYKKLSINFLPENWNVNAAGRSNSSFNGFTLKDSIFNNAPYNETTTYLNNYFNFLSRNRDQRLSEYTYVHPNNVVQNQWVVKVPIEEGAPENGYRYDFMYGISSLMQYIVYPFSMFETILGHKNDLYIENNYAVPTHGKHISRFVDPTTDTIVYSNQLVTRDNTMAVYPPNLLSNDIFLNFVDSKRGSTDYSVPKVIDITFRDWVNNAWTGIEPNLDIIRILDETNTTVNNFTIPKIIMVNNNSLVELQGYEIDYNLVESIALISVIVVIVLIEILLIVRICRTSGYYKWSLTTAQDECGY